VNRPLKNYFIALMVFALGGLLLSGISTYDFVAHLDRQVHSITCSFVPGMGPADASGSSGCHTVLMSPYSSVFRSMLWGGIPIALPAFAVFAYLLWRAADLWMRREEHEPDETRYLVAATALPLVMTVVYFIISSLLIGALCKVCIGIYVCSVGGFVAALLVHRNNARRVPPDEFRPMPWSTYGIYFAEGVVFVLIPVLLYVALKPEYTSAMAQCGELPHPEDKYGVMLTLGEHAGASPAIEVLDPLCPACRGFSQRLEASGLNERLDLKVVMFPLDKECNWMVSSSLHPGACAVSEAMLCAGPQAGEVLRWAFEHQDELREMAVQSSQPVYARIKETFPAVANCVGKPAVRAKLNKSLRWAVSNAVPVLTPQLYVRGQKVCDEDTDLGLEYALTRMLDAQELGSVQAREAQ